MLQPGLILKRREHWTDVELLIHKHYSCVAQVMRGRGFWSPIAILVWDIVIKVSVLQGHATPRVELSPNKWYSQ